jgi:hypothetical protein
VADSDGLRRERIHDIEKIAGHGAHPEFRIIPGF